MSKREQFLFGFVVIVFAVVMTALTVYNAKAQVSGEFTAFDDLEIRDAPHLAGDVIGELQKGESVMIYGIPVHSDGIMWGATRSALRSWVPLWEGDCIEYFEFTNGKRACTLRAKDHEFGAYIEQ